MTLTDVFWGGYWCFIWRYPVPAMIQKHFHNMEWFSRKQIITAPKWSEIITYHLGACGVHSIKWQHKTGKTSRLTVLKPKMHIYQRFLIEKLAFVVSMCRLNLHKNHFQKHKLDINWLHCKTLDKCNPPVCIWWYVHTEPMAPCKIRASTGQPVEWLPWKPRHEMRRVGGAIVNANALISLSEAKEKTSNPTLKIE